MTGYYFQTGTIVAYSGELPCEDASHVGTVIAVEPDMSGDEIVTVEFDCGATQDIPSSELKAAVLVGDTYETPEGAAEYAAREAEALGDTIL